MDNFPSNKSEADSSESLTEQASNSDVPLTPPPFARQASIGPEGPPPPQHIFSPHVRPLHIQIWIKTVINLIVMSALILAILSVYWGSLYGRAERIHNLNVWVLNYDTDPDAFVGPMFVDYIDSLGYPNTHLGYQIMDPAAYDGDVTTVAHDTVQEAAWGILTVAPNASSYLMENMANPQADFDPSYLVTFWYVEARAETTAREIIVPQILNISAAFSTVVRQSWVERVNRTLSLEQRTRIVDINVNILANPIFVTLENLRPFKGDVSSAILTTGLIFLIIVSFFQIPFFAPVHLILLGKIKFLQYMVYRPFINYVSVLFLSLAFSLVSLAFQESFSHTYGRGGFVIYWMINFLAMNALGGASENIATIIFNTYPSAIGFWLIFWVCMNSSTSFAPLELLPEVYRVGRALPVHNAQMAIRTVLFGTRNRIGLNVGVFFGWIAVNYIVSFPAIIFVKKYKIYQAKRAAAQQAAAREAEAKSPDGPNSA